MSLAFDSAYYLKNNQDVDKAISNGEFKSAQQHWELFGAQEGRNPNAVFNTAEYLAANPDVAESDLNPLDHFQLFGAGEGRAPSASYVEVAQGFDEKAYLDDNEDVADAVAEGAFASGYHHWVLFGEFENNRDEATYGNGKPVSDAIADNGNDGDDNEGDDNNGGGNQTTFNVAQAKILTDLPDVYTLQDSAKNLLRTKSDDDPTLVNADVMENAARINVTDKTVTAEQADILADFKAGSDYTGDINIHIVANRDEFEGFGDVAVTGPDFINLEGLNIGEVVSDFAGEAGGLNAYYEGGSSDTTFVMQGQENTSQAVYFEGYGDDTLNVAVQDNDNAAAFYFDGSDYAGGSGSPAIRTINIDSREDDDSGVNKVTLKSDTVNLKDINVTGGGDFELVNTGSANNVIESFNASEATGDVTLDASVFAGSSSVITGSGDDTITVGTGTAELTGGTGEDMFVFAEQSQNKVTITDFNSGEDTINLSGLIASDDVSFVNKTGIGRENVGDFSIKDNSDEVTVKLDEGDLTFTLEGLADDDNLLPEDFSAVDIA